MIRTLIAAALLAPTVAWADDPPAVPKPPEACAQLMDLRISEGNTLKGPIEIAKTGDNGSAVVTLLAGMELKGPLKIEVCDGRVTISKD